MENRVVKLETNGALGPVLDLYGPKACPLERLGGRSDPALVEALEHLFADAMERIPGRDRNRPYFDEVGEAKAVKKYYSGLSMTRDPQRNFKALSTILENTHTERLSYDTARRRHLYPIVDLHPDGKLRGVYTGKAFSSEQAILEDLMADYASGELSPALEKDRRLAPLLAALEAALDFRPAFNCEHSVPQSWYDRKNPMRGDLHTLFTADVSCNSRRSNYPYGDQGGSSGGACGINEDEVFEPARNKGAVARATLYFLARYPKAISEKDMPRETIETLLRWHEAEPPSLWEKHRNQEIARIQGNRNPFIDHPEWARSIDFEAGLRLKPGPRAKAA